MSLVTLSVAEDPIPALRRSFSTAPRWTLDPDGDAASPPAAVWYRFGEASLRLACGNASFLSRLGELYGDCQISPLPSDEPALADEPALVQCELTTSADSELARLTFQAGAPSDPLDRIISQLYPPAGSSPYLIGDGDQPGWRAIRGGGDLSRPIVEARGADLFVDTRWAPMDLVADFLVSSTLAAQPGLLTVHGAALRIGELGVVVTGYSGSGKSTTALHLAARGHALLGDELAVVRLASGELLSLPRTVNIRPGPRDESLARIIRPFSAADGAADDAWTGRIRLSAMFPSADRRPTRLHSVFFLDGFADTPSVTACRPTLREGDLFYPLANDMINGSWGAAPARRAFRLLVLKELLARVNCWSLTVGAPDATAHLIESVVKEQQ